MNGLPLIAVGVAGCTLLVGFGLALLGMRCEAPWKLDETAPNRTAAFARWPTGCYVRGGDATAPEEQDV